MLIEYIIETNKTDLHYRIIGTDSVVIEENMAPLILTHTIYGVIPNATDNTIEYLKEVLGSKINEYEQLIIDTINNTKGSE